MKTIQLTAPSTLVAEGDRLRDRGDFEAALASYRRVAEDAVDGALGHFKMGTVYSRMDRDHDAEQCYLQAAKLRPGYPQALNNLALLCAKRAENDQAEQFYREVLADHPDYPESHINLGNLLLDTGRLRETQYHFRRAVSLNPQSALTHDRLGAVLRSRGRITEAIGEFKRAVELDQTSFTAWHDLGTCYFVLGAHVEADRAFRKAIDLSPDQATGSWSNWLFMSNCQDLARAEVAERHFMFGRQVRAMCGPLAARQAPRPLSGGRRLRLGFVSGDFRRHSVAYFLKDSLQSIDRDQFESYAYTTCRDIDEVTESLKPLFAEWRNLTGLSDKVAARLIEADDIDILIDLSGHTNHNRLWMFGYKPAPIQVSWIGYPNTTGLDCMDYRLTDSLVDPDSSEDVFYSEKLFRLPGSFLCFSPPQVAAPAPSDMQRPRQGAITFGSFNARVKLGEECIALWSQTLLAVPDSRLVIKSYSGLEEDAAREDLVARFVACGVDSRRIIVRTPVEDSADHLAAYAEVDVALDAYPYNGTATTCEALWMGVPVVTLAGDRHASRVGLALVTRLGFPQWAARTPAAFVAAAAELVRDRNQLSALRGSLRKRMQESELLDGTAMGLQLGAAFRSMWQDYCAGFSSLDGGGETQDAQPEGESPPASALVHPAPDGKASRGPLRNGQRPAQDPEVISLMKLVEAHRYEDTERLARRMLARRPNHQLAIRALSFALIGLAQFDKALPIAKWGVEQSPGDPELLNNLGIIQSELMLWNEAVPTFQSALALAPDDPDIHRNLGAGYFHMHRWAAAVPPLLKAIELYDGDYVEAICLLATALLNERRTDEAIVCCEELVKSDSTHPEYHYMLVGAAAHQCRWRELGASIDRVWDVCDSNRPFPFANPFAALPLPGVSNERLWHIAQSHALGRTGGLASSRIPPTPMTQSRPLRIGYLSGDFMPHPVGYVLPKVIECHDPARVETWGLSIGPDEESPIRTRLIDAFDHFIDLEPCNIEETVSRIRALGLDILVDLSGWTALGRLEALALRCAPIQVNWLGYAGTMGRAELADYIVGDATVLPMDHASFYSEAIAHMPHSFMPADPLESDLAAPSRESEGLPAIGLVFCSFNRCYKFNPQNFDLWCRLLRDIPGSVLWLGNMIDSAAANIRVEAQARGVDPARIVIARHAKTRSGHLARMQLADIALDPFPYNSHSSGVEILQAGVPMISLLGETFAGRVGASLLRAAGLPDLVVETHEDYYALAKRLAMMPGELAAIKARLAGALRDSPLVDMESFSRSLEDLYFRMWADACAGVRRPLT